MSLQKLSDVRSFNINDTVYARNYSKEFSSDKWLAGKITKKLGALLYELTLEESSKRIRRHLDQLRERTDPSLDDVDLDSITPATPSPSFPIPNSSPTHPNRPSRSRRPNLRYYDPEFENLRGGVL